MIEQDQKNEFRFELLQKRDIYYTSTIMISTSILILTVNIFQKFIGMTNWKHVSALCAIFAFIILLLHFFCALNTDFDKFFRYRQVSFISLSTYVYLDFIGNVKLNCILPVFINAKYDETYYYIEYKRNRYIYDIEQQKFVLPETFIGKEFKFFLNSNPMDDNQSKVMLIKNGENLLNVNVPPFINFFIKSSYSPKILIPIGVSISHVLQKQYILLILSLAAGIYMIFAWALIDAIPLVVFRTFEDKAYNVEVQRHPAVENDWITLKSSNLVPGEIIDIESIKNNKIPCDLLLINCTCRVNESLLTGESLSRQKEGIYSHIDTKIFNYEEDNKIHILYAGTRIVSNITPIDEKMSKEFGYRNKGFVLRTGFNTTKGESMKSFMTNIDQIIFYDKEFIAFMIISIIYGLLLMFFIYFKVVENSEKNFASNISNCLIIFTNSSQFNTLITFEMILYICLFRFFYNDVFCSEFRKIALCGKIDVACFDKTGTLTSDEYTVIGICGIGENPFKIEKTNISKETKMILIGCHSIEYKTDKAINGDSIEVSAINLVNHQFIQNDIIKCMENMHSFKVEILERYSFFSNLKRMSCICRITEENESKYYILIKGAPETLQKMFISSPANYSQIHYEQALNGSRIIALGYKEIKNNDINEINKQGREFWENDLIFSGFMVANCQIKDGSEKNISNLRKLGIYTVIISGDHPNTASYVCDKLKMSSKPILVLSKDDKDELVWKSTKSASEKPVPFNPNLIDSLMKEYNFCLTGESLNYMHKKKDLTLIFDKIFLSIKVFARVKPLEKKEIIKKFIEKNLYTFMCGDGANDMAALQLAHVGVAITKNADDKDTNLDDYNENIDENIDENKNNQESLFQIYKNSLFVSLKSWFSVKYSDVSIAAPISIKNNDMNIISYIIKNCIFSVAAINQMLIMLSISAITTSYYYFMISMFGDVLSQRQKIFHLFFVGNLDFSSLLYKNMENFPEIKPIRNIFNGYIFPTILFQSVLNISCMILTSKFIYHYYPLSNLNLSLELSNNLFLSLIYILQLYFCVSIFVINFSGNRYSVNLIEYKFFFSYILFLVGILCLLIWNCIPWLDRNLKIVSIPLKVKIFISILIISHFAISNLVDKALCYFFGKNSICDPDTKIDLKIKNK